MSSQNVTGDMVIYVNNFTEVSETLTSC